MKALLRVYIDESAVAGHGNGLNALVEAALQAGLSGATAFKGIYGYGRSRYVSSSWVVDAYVALPIVLQIIDDEAKLRAFLPIIERTVSGGTASLARVSIVGSNEIDDRAPNLI